MVNVNILLNKLFFDLGYLYGWLNFIYFLFLFFKNVILKGNYFKYKEFIWKVVFVLNNIDF